MPTLSIAMIVKDESGRLPRCLASVGGLADQIVVVDTGSGDGTPELARSRGAEVFHLPWGDDFAAARNAALGHCRGDWVLVLDADETLDALDHPRLREALADPRAQAYRLILRNYYAGGGRTIQGVPPVRNTSPYTEGREFSHYADGYGLRLCRRLPGLAFEGRIHELLDPFFTDRGLPILDLPVVIHHFGKVDEAREARKRTYYLELAVREARDRPESPQAWFNVLQQAMNADDWPRTLEAAQACLRLAPPPHPLALLGAGMALQFQDRHPEALGYLERLTALAPGQAQGHTRRGVSLAALGRLDEAREALRMAIRHQPGFIVPYVNLAELESQQGRPAEARMALEDGLRVSPTDPQLLHARVQLAVATGDLGQAVQDAEAAIRICPEGGQGVWHRLVAFRHLADQRPAQALEVIEAGLRVFPGDPDLLRLKGMAKG